MYKNKVLSVVYFYYRIHMHDQNKIKIPVQRLTTLEQVIEDVVVATIYSNIIDIALS